MSNQRDELRVFQSAIGCDHLHEIKSMLINRYGDFDVRAVSDQWGAKLEYLCEQFNNDKRAFYEKKKAWCEKYGCE